VPLPLAHAQDFWCQPPYKGVKEVAIVICFHRLLPIFSSTQIVKHSEGLQFISIAGQNDYRITHRGTRPAIA